MENKLLDFPESSEEQSGDTEEHRQWEKPDWFFPLRIEPQQTWRFPGCWAIPPMLHSKHLRLVSFCSFLSLATFSSILTSHFYPSPPAFILFLIFFFAKKRKCIDVQRAFCGLSPFFFPPLFKMRKPHMGVIIRLSSPSLLSGPMPHTCKFRARHNSRPAGSKTMLPAKQITNECCCHCRLNSPEAKVLEF